MSQLSGIKIGFALALLFATLPALGDGHDACQGCHDADEFSGMSAEAIAAAVKDISIRSHKRFKDLSDETIAAIAGAFADG
jgi:hypothetical protein